MMYNNRVHLQGGGAGGGNLQAANEARQRTCGKNRS